MVSVNKDPIFPSVSVCVLPRAMRHTEAPLACFSQTQVHCCCAQPTIQSACFQWIPSTLGSSLEAHSCQRCLVQNPPRPFGWKGQSSQNLPSPRQKHQRAAEAPMCVMETFHQTQPTMWLGKVWYGISPYLSISPMQLLKHLKFPHCTG